MIRKLNQSYTGSIAAQDKKDCGGCLATSTATEKLARGAVDNCLRTSTAVDKMARSSNLKIRKLKIATFNVRTLADTIFESPGLPNVKNKIEQLIRGCKQKKIGIDIMCIQEHRLKTNQDEEIGYITQTNRATE
ncbi:unnamed protein product [Brachionus calyciflorus]|uniref:Uncharacterized protein n=1 Tax=Brachionus calyciflorus TaxID=104777 RepID=A0A814QHQ6_9BILA|nr:unnamed protein product [Brachionus calyciflorus]